MHAFKSRFLAFYLIHTLGLGAAFLLVHWDMTARRGGLPVPSGNYSIAIWIAAVISCILYIKYIIQVMKIDRTAGFLLPVMFIFGSVVACYGALDVYNDHSQKIVTVTSADEVRSSNAAFFQIKRINPMVEHMVDTLTYKTESGRTTSRFPLELEYESYVPLAPRADLSGFTVWIKLTRLDSYNPGNEEERKRLIDAGRRNDRQWAKDFRFDSITFFERNASSERVTGIQGERPRLVEGVVLRPNFGTFHAFQLTEVLMYLGVYLMPTFLFAGLVWSIGMEKKAAGG